MSKPPPENLMEWPKGELAKEVARLRAIVREHAESRGTDARRVNAPGAVTTVDQDIYAEGSSIVDARQAVLMDSTDSVLVDTHKDAERVLMMLVLSGRINYSDERVAHPYLLDPDGAAVIAVHLVSLATRAMQGNLDHGKRFGVEFMRAFERRMREAT